MLHSAEQKGLPADFIGLEEAHASWLDTAPVTFQTDPQVKNKKINIIYTQGRFLHLTDRNIWIN